MHLPQGLPMVTPIYPGYGCRSTRFIGSGMMVSTLEGPLGTSGPTLRAVFRISRGLPSESAEIAKTI
jgi:hypothetical protein